MSIKVKSFLKGADENSNVTEESVDKVNEEAVGVNEIIDLALLDLENKDILQESTLNVCYSSTDLHIWLRSFFK